MSAKARHSPRLVVLLMAHSKLKPTNRAMLYISYGQGCRKFGLELYIQSAYTSKITEEVSLSLRTRSAPS
jgi:hypothetical protein